MCALATAATETVTAAVLGGRSARNAVFVSARFAGLAAAVAAAPLTAAVMMRCTAGMTILVSRRRVRMTMGAGSTARAVGDGLSRP